ncbi:MAG: MarR family transcriptional regulator [Polyangiaceae bacterium]|nr:MarR family transcriptional regulator [Polyangiaceae bacterium]
MSKKADAKTAGDLDRLLHDVISPIDRALGISIVKVISACDVNLSQITILDLLRQGPQTVSSLSKELRLTPGGVSRLVDRLVRRGLVSRREGANSRRQKA